MAPEVLRSRAAVEAVNRAIVAKAAVNGTADTFYVCVSKEDALGLLRTGQFEVFLADGVAYVDALSRGAR